MSERASRSVIHCDMDAFYASVEQLKNPQLRGKPVIIGGNPHSRGVVSTCSYEAREFGIHSAMPLAEAYRRCPHGIFLSPDFAAYKEMSAKMHGIFSDYTPLIEPLSLDEAFLDVTGSINLFGSASVIGMEIKNRIKAELGLTVSVGVAHNKFLAKLASDLSKPDGFLIVPYDNVQKFLDPLAVKRLWGVGEKTAERLKNLNIKTVRDVRKLSEAHLVSLFGSYGHQLYQLARGVDERPVETGRMIKSVGRETTFAKDLTSKNALEEVVLRLSEDVGRTLRKEGLKGKTVTLKIKYDDFKTITRSKTLDCPTDLDEDIFTAARLMLQDVVTKPVRLAGVSINNFTEPDEAQLAFFTDTGEDKEKLARAIDLVREKYGKNSITRARLLKPKR